MQGFPVYSQGVLGDCYSHAAAILYDSYRESKGLRKNDPEQFSSPLLIGIKQTRKLSTLPREEFTQEAVEELTKKAGKLRFPFEGGNVCDAVDSAARSGTCDMRDAELQLTQISRGDFVKNYYSLFLDHYLYLEKRDWFRDYADPEIRKQVLDTVVSSFSNRLRVCLHQYGLEEELLPNRELLEAVLHFGSPYFLFMNTFQTACTEHAIPPQAEIVCNDYSLYHPSDLKSAVESHFLRPTLPMGLYICSEFFKNPGYVSRDSSGALKADCGKHVVVVMGRRFNSDTKTCQYLIQNSWGVDCPDYKYKSPHQCEPSTGRVWVSESDLFKASYGVITVK